VVSQIVAGGCVPFQFLLVAIVRVLLTKTNNDEPPWVHSRASTEFYSGNDERLRPVRFITGSSSLPLRRDSAIPRVVLGGLISGVQQLDWRVEKTITRRHDAAMKGAR
jgi:hypothetical protein